MDRFVRLGQVYQHDRRCHFCKQQYDVSRAFDRNTQQETVICDDCVKLNAPSGEVSLGGGGLKNDSKNANDWDDKTFAERRHEFMGGTPGVDADGHIDPSVSGPDLASLAASELIGDRRRELVDKKGNVDYDLMTADEFNRVLAAIKSGHASSYSRVDVKGEPAK